MPPLLDDKAIVRANLPEEEDPALKPFLDLLEKDIRKNPKRVTPISSALMKKARSLVKGIKVDLDGPLTGKD